MFNIVAPSGDMTQGDLFLFLLHLGVPNFLSIKIMSAFDSAWQCSKL